MLTGRHTRSGVESTFLARPLRRPEPPRARLCPYCDEPAAAEELTCGGPDCRARLARLNNAMSKILEGIP